MAWQLIAAAAIPAVTSLISQGLNKPKKSDYAPQTKYMEKYLSQLRGKQTENEVFKMAMQPALRTIGAQGRKTSREIGYMTERSGLAGSGIEAQARLSAGQQTQEALAQATEKATAAQIGESRRLGEEATRVTAGIEQEKERAERAYQQAKRQHKTQMQQTLVQGVGAVAGAGLQASYTAGQEASQLGMATEMLGGGEDAALRIAEMKKTMNVPDILKLVEHETGLLKSAGGTREQYYQFLEETGGGGATDTAPITETGAGTSFFKENILNDLSSAQSLQDTPTQFASALDETIPTGETPNLPGTPDPNRLAEMVGKDGGIQLPPYPVEREEFSATPSPPPYDAPKPEVPEAANITKLDVRKYEPDYTKDIKKVDVKKIDTDKWYPGKKIKEFKSGIEEKINRYKASKSEKQRIENKKKAIEHMREAKYPESAIMEFEETGKHKSVSKGKDLTISMGDVSVDGKKVGEITDVMSGTPDKGVLFKIEKDGETQYWITPPRGSKTTMDMRNNLASSIFAFDDEWAEHELEMARRKGFKLVGNDPSKEEEYKRRLK